MLPLRNLCRLTVLALLVARASGTGDFLRELENDALESVSALAGGAHGPPPAPLPESIAHLTPHEAALIPPRRPFHPRPTDDPKWRRLPDDVMTAAMGIAEQRSVSPMLVRQAAAHTNPIDARRFLFRSTSGTQMDHEVLVHPAAFSELMSPVARNNAVKSSMASGAAEALKVHVLGGHPDVLAYHKAVMVRHADESSYSSPPGPPKGGDQAERPEGSRRKNRRPADQEAESSRNDRATSRPRHGPSPSRPPVQAAPERKTYAARLEALGSDNSGKDDVADLLRIPRELRGHSASPSLPRERAGSALAKARKQLNEGFPSSRPNLPTAVPTPARPEDSFVAAFMKWQEKEKLRKALSANPNAGEPSNRRPHSEQGSRS